LHCSELFCRSQLGIGPKYRSHWGYLEAGMGRASQRLTREYLEETPEFDPATAEIARVLEIRGKGLILLSTGDDERTTLAVLPPRFRGTLWLRRGRP